MLKNTLKSRYGIKNLNDYVFSCEDRLLSDLDGIFAGEEEFIELRIEVKVEVRYEFHEEYSSIRVAKNAAHS